jgi:cytochrome c oxidase subunit 3
MSIPVLFLVMFAAIAGWWFVANRLTAKPWESPGLDASVDAGPPTPPARIGLWVFLAVVGSFFGLFVSAYSMRMMLPDWQRMPEPGLLWINTALLVLSSAAFEWTRYAAEAGSPGRVKGGLAVAGALSMAFLVGQLVAWQQLDASGYFVYDNAANAFFYLLTGLHGVHLLGGLAVWGRATGRMWTGAAKLGEVRLSVQLCAVYWHFLLLVWLVLFGLLLTT